MVTDRRLDRGPIDRPHAPPQRLARCSDDDGLAAAILLKGAALHITCFFHTIDQTRQVVLGQKHFAFELKRRTSTLLIGSAASGFLPGSRRWPLFGKNFRHAPPKSKRTAYWHTQSTRPSLRHAFASDYNARLWTFLQSRHPHLSRIIAQCEN